VPCTLTGGQGSPEVLGEGFPAGCPRRSAAWHGKCRRAALGMIDLAGPAGTQGREDDGGFAKHSTVALLEGAPGAIACVSADGPASTGSMPGRIGCRGDGAGD